MRKAKPAAAHAPPKLNHGAIGNGRVLALVAPSSAIEWLCLPRFDSPSVFARLLDRENGGHFSICHGDEEIEGRLSYLANTNILVTRFEHGETAWEVIDFAPRVPSGLTNIAPLEIVRVIRPVRGQPRLRVVIDARPDYARKRARMTLQHYCVKLISNGDELHVTSSIPAAYIVAAREFVLNRTHFITLSWGERSPLTNVADALHSLDLTAGGWRAWAKSCALLSFAGGAVLRSALCLDLHAYTDTGAIIAAATTSIPEAFGTERTWDYRYCWLRDSAFVVEALRRLGQLSEGEAFMRYLRDVAEAGPLQPVYGIGGERELHEKMLPHLAGFGGNGYVRVGNAAYAQRQHDVMGELILCLDTLLNDPRVVHNDPTEFFPLIRRLVEDAMRAAYENDTGIWEFRTSLGPHTFSRAMCWAAVHRGAALARRFNRGDLAVTWDNFARTLRDEILTRGYNAKFGAFTQLLDGEYADAANLLLPTIGIIDARDPRFVSTLATYEKALGANGLLRRYVHRDDFGDTTSAFTMCSFWWAEALALGGELDRAVALFERLLSYANPLGLFSEDIDPASGALLGNFPQAYTHAGLIHAAMTISRMLDVRNGTVRAWG